VLLHERCTRFVTLLLDGDDTGRCGREGVLLGGSLPLQFLFVGSLYDQNPAWPLRFFSALAPSIDHLERICF
jgi:hypothetical protein